MNTADQHKLGAMAPSQNRGFMQHRKKPQWSIKKMPREPRKKQQQPFGKSVAALANLGAVVSFGFAASSVLLGFLTIQFYTRTLKIPYLRPVFFQYSFTTFFILFLVTMISIFMALGSGIVAGYGQRYATPATSSSNSFIRRFIRTHRFSTYLRLLFLAYFLTFLAIYFAIELNLPACILLAIFMLVFSNFLTFSYKEVFDVSAYVIVPSFFSAFSSLLFALTFLPGTVIGYAKVSPITSLEATVEFLILPFAFSIISFLISLKWRSSRETRFFLWVTYPFSLILILTLPFLALPEHLIFGTGLGYFQIKKDNEKLCVAANVGDKMFLYPVRGKQTFIQAKATEISMEEFIKQPYIDTGMICPPVIDEMAPSAKPAKLLQNAPSKHPTGG